MLGAQLIVSCPLRFTDLANRLKYHNLLSAGLQQTISADQKDVTIANLLSWVWYLSWSLYLLFFTSLINSWLAQQIWSHCKCTSLYLRSALALYPILACSHHPEKCPTEWVRVLLLQFYWIVWKKFSSFCGPRRLHGVILCEPLIWIPYSSS